ncbi:MAG: hypothetical protein ABIM44_04905 [candidate division WOR-3 bacterium]
MRDKRIPPTTLFTILKFMYPSPPPSSQIFIPSLTIHGIEFIDVRSFDKMSFQIDADKAISVDIQNSPDGDISNAKDLAGYSLPSEYFEPEKRNIISIDGANTLLGFIRIKISTQTEAPSSVTVWFIASKE